ncbi:MAG: ABC transporter permease [Limisphaerales bacterium]
MNTAVQIAFKEFSDRFRSGWVIACTAVWLGAIALTSLFGLIQIGKIGWQGYERTVVSLLNLVQYLVPLLALLLGHDLVVSEREDRTIGLSIASGVSRAQLLVGKFLGGCLALAFPVTLGFIIAGVVIGLGAGRSGIGNFVMLALSGLGLGIIFLAIGLVVSIVCRTRVQSLVIALLMWCAAVFVFDLVALGVVVSTRTNEAAKQIETVTDAMHVNAVADMHQTFESGVDNVPKAKPTTTRILFWTLLANPVDLFRAINLPATTEAQVPVPVIPLAFACWIAAALGAGFWRLRRLDL